MWTENQPSRPRLTWEEVPHRVNDVPRLDTASIFREMIAREVRDGELTPWRRRRIVRYAAGLRLSATEAGRLIEECRRAASAKTEECSTPDLRLVTHEKKGLSRVGVFCVVLGGVIVVQWLISLLFV